jgi:NTP pyrophosphatase (non-canonical NTP hydrolase)
MSLNKYRDEVGEFLEQIAAREEPTSRVIDMLDEEITLLKESLNDRERLNHQLYDVLFLIFEIATIYNLDMDTEWTVGRERKRARYLERG